MSVTIFVTAYNCYAAAVFEAHPLDYLLKPFSDEFKVLSDGTELKLSRGYRHRLEEQLGQSLWCEIR